MQNLSLSFFSLWLCCKQALRGHAAVIHVEEAATPTHLWLILFYTLELRTEVHLAMILFFFLNQNH